MIWTLAIVLVLAALAIAENRRLNKKDEAVLRHTIEVNLGILKGELERLAPLAKSLPADDQAEADKLLSRSRKIVSDVEPRIATAPRRELGKLLRGVFSAMNTSTELHKLLAKYSLVPTIEDMPLE